MSKTTTELSTPYPGLRPFEKEDHPVFFGREAQVGALLTLLEDHAFVAVLGSSGCGKSSLVRAGLLPAVRDGFLLGTTNWCFVVLKPGDQPYERLVRELARSLYSEDQNRSASPGDAQTTSKHSRILKTLLKSDRGLLDVINESEISPDTNVLVVVDQFEELFAFRRASAKRDLVVSRDEAAAFVNTLLSCCANAEGRIRVVLTMRSDFVGDCEAFLGLPETVSRSQFLVPRLDRGQMEEAITRPGTVNGAFSPFTVEPELVTRIINDAGDRPDQLPLMQHALMRTWKFAVKRASGEGASVRLVHKDYDDAGGIAEALSRHAEDAWKLIGGDQRREETARRLFLLLCDISPDGQITRRRPRVEEVEAVTGANGEQIEKLIRIFQDDDRNFLLPPQNGPLQPSDRLDISHEALLRQWPRFSGWQEQERQDSLELVRLVESARNYYQIPRKGGLLPAEDVDRIEKWKKRVSLKWAGRYVTETQEAWVKAIAFFQESQNHVKKQRLYKRSLIAAGILVPLIFLFQAERAKTEIGKVLIDQFNGTIGISDVFEPSATERAALWKLAELETDRANVRKELIDQWFQTGDILNALRHDARGLQAAVGMNSELQRHVASHAGKFTDGLVKESLNTPIGSDSLSMPTELANLAPRMAPQDAASLGGRLVAVLEASSRLPPSLINVLTNLAARMEPQDAARLANRLLMAIETDPDRVSGLTEVLTNLAARMGPDGAPSIAKRLVAVLETETDSVTSLVLTVAQLVVSMEPKAGADIALRTVQIVASRLENQTSDDFTPLDLSGFGAVTTLTSHMKSDDAANVANRLVTPLVNPQTHINRLPALSATIAALTAEMEPREVARLADALAEGFKAQQPDPDRLSNLSGAVRAVAAQMKSSDAAGIAKSLVGAVSNSQLDPGSLTNLSRAVAALAVQMQPPDAADVAIRTAEAVAETLVRTRGAANLSGLSAAAGELSNMLAPSDAGRLAERLEKELENPRTDTGVLYSLSSVVGKLTARANPDDVARLAERFADEFVNSPTEKRRSASGAAVAALAAQMKRDDAASLAGRLAQQLENPRADTKRLPALGTTVAALAARMEPKDAASLAARGAKVIAERLANTRIGDSNTLSDLGIALGRLSSFIPSTGRETPERETPLLALSNVLLRQVPGPPKPGEEESEIRKDVANLCGRLSPQDLAEVLKWPVSTGEAQRIVVAELERKSGQKFGGDLFTLAEQAQAMRISALNAPAKLPRAENALEELRRFLSTPSTH